MPSIDRHCHVKGPGHRCKPWIITMERDLLCINFCCKQLINFGIPQCSPAGTTKQILIQFWQVICKAKIEKQMESAVFFLLPFFFFCQRVHTCKKYQMFKHSTCCTRAKNHRIYPEGVMRAERLSCLSERYSLKTFTFPNICSFYNLTKLTMTVIQ